MIPLDAELRARLIETARTLATTREWPWRDPVEVSAGVDGGEPVWIVSTNVLSRGMNVRVVLRRSDQSVVRAGYLPR